MDLSCFGEIVEGISFLSEENLVYINERLIKEQTPDEPIAILKPNELKSSQSRPSFVRYYEQTNDIYRLSSVLIYSLIKNHPFANANKRTAMMAGYIFLLLNGYELTAPDHEMIEITVGVACGEYSEKDLENWLNHWSREFDTRKICIKNEMV